MKEGAAPWTTDFPEAAMTQDESFLQAIRAEPDDDTVRLIYADWLMEQDDPVRAERGEFIRLQIEHARLPPGHEQRQPLEQRQQELLARHWEAWIGPLRELCGGGRSVLHWMAA